jgi:hypothetical protein
MKSTGDLYFDLFWSAYPKRVKKILALREWKRLKDFTIKEIVEGIERWKQTKQWQDIQFIPDPERFLKYRRWEDEVPVAKTEGIMEVKAGLAKSEYLKFIDLRDAKRIPAEVNWEKWRNMTAEERQKAMRAA